MVKAKVLKLVLDDHGSYLSMEKGCFIVKDKHGNVERYPMFENEIGEIALTSGNFISTGVLASCGFWGASAEKPSTRRVFKGDGED